jgi:hypothetical protein
MGVTGTRPLVMPMVVKQMTRQSHHGPAQHDVDAPKQHADVMEHAHDNRVPMRPQTTQGAKRMKRLLFHGNEWLTVANSKTQKKHARKSFCEKS